MTWTKEHDVMLCREMLLIQPFRFKHGTRDRGRCWEKIAQNLSDIVHLIYSVDMKGVRDHIYINDLLLSIQDTDICNYADDTTIYACDNNLDNVLARLENDSNIIIQWFADNCMKLNTDKCHLLILCRNSNQQITVNVGDSVIENTEEETLLGVVIDKRLNF